MNYIKQLNAFYKIVPIKQIGSNAKNLYETLLYINSSCYWKSDFAVANLYLMSLTGLNKQAIYRARNELVQKDLIEFKKGINQNEAGKYTIYEFVTADDTADDTAHNTPNDTPNDTAGDTINKQNKTKQNKTKIKKEKTKKRNETEFDLLINQSFSNEELKDTVYEFIKMRKAIDKPLTTRGLELMIKKLCKLTTNIDEQIEILNNSIMNNWQGIFPLNSQNNFNKNSEMQGLKNYDYKGDDTL